VLQLIWFGLLIGWRFFDVGGASGSVVEGQYDPRGFQPVYVDAETDLPVRFNPCEPIHYVINPSFAPEGGVDDVHHAFEITGRSMGVSFIFDGTTDETYASERDSYQPERYGERWAPILVSCSNGSLATEEPSAHPRAVGLGGGSVEFNSRGEPVYVTGIVMLDANAELHSGFGGRTWGQVMLHEIGHVVGLAHINDQTSVMYPEMGLRPAAFGQGDRAGLMELGIGTSCVLTPDVP
jgi:Matrixin